MHDAHGAAGNTGDHTAPAHRISIGNRLERLAQREANEERNKQRSEHVREGLAVVGVPEIGDQNRAGQAGEPVSVWNSRKQTNDEPYGHDEHGEAGFEFFIFSRIESGQPKGHLRADDQPDEGREGPSMVIQKIVLDAGWYVFQERVEQAVRIPRIAQEHEHEGHER